MSDAKERPLLFIQTILDALQDPYNPTICSSSLSVALSSLQGFKPANKHDARMHNKLLETLYRFLVVKRPLDQLEEWMKRFSRCNDCRTFRKNAGRPLVDVRAVSAFCHSAWETNKEQKDLMLRMDYHWYSPNLRTGENTSTYSADSCTFMVRASDFVSNYTNVDFKSVRRGTSKRWPKNISDFTPHGPEQLVESCLQWHSIHPASPTLALLTMAAKICRSQLYPSLIKHKYFPTAVNWMKRVLDATLVTLERAHSLQPDKALDLLTITVRCAVVFSACIDVVINQALPFRVQALLMDGYEVKATQVCSLLVSIIPKLSRLHPPTKLTDYEDSLMAGLPIKASYIYRSFAIDARKSPGRDFLLARSIVDHDRETYFGSEERFEAELGLSILWESGISYGCSGKIYGCNQWLETAGRDLKLCKGCLGVFYCGKECQKKAWNDMYSPHKDICPALAIIAEEERRFLPKVLKPDSMPAYRVLKATYSRHGVMANMEKVHNVRGMIGSAKVDIDVDSSLREWGRKIYDNHTIMKDSQGNLGCSGFEDYDAIVERLTDTSGAYNVLPFATMTQSPSKEIEKQKYSAIFFTESDEEDTYSFSDE